MSHFTCEAREEFLKLFEKTDFENLDSPEGISVLLLEYWDCEDIISSSDRSDINETIEYLYDKYMGADSKELKEVSNCFTYAQVVECMLPVLEEIYKKREVI